MYKNKLFLIILPLVFCSSMKSIEINNILQDDNKILWSSDRRLKWEDFKGTPDTINFNAEAVTSSQIEVIDGYFENGVPKYVVECYFIKNKSWTKTQDKYTLSHEQLHFDIHELFTRKIRKSFDSLNVLKVQKQETYNKIFEKYGKKCNSYNDLYDSQVYFDSIRQKLWIDKISIKLNELKEYE